MRDPVIPPHATIELLLPRRGGDLRRPASPENLAEGDAEAYPRHAPGPGPGVRCPARMIGRTWRVVREHYFEVIERMVGQGGVAE